MHQTRKKLERICMFGRMEFSSCHLKDYARYVLVVKECFRIHRAAHQMYFEIKPYIKSRNPIEKGNLRDTVISVIHNYHIISS